MLRESTPKRIVHIITGLETGGAEMMLLKLVRAGSGKFSHSVISLGTSGTIGPMLTEAGATVSAMELKRGSLPSFKALRLVDRLNELNPSVVQGWMYHGNLAATFGHALTKRRAALTWSVRCSLNASGVSSWLTRGVIRAGATLSRLPSAVVYNSETARQQHRASGYADSRAITIPNGFDTQAFRIDEDARSAMRQRLGIASDKFVVGIIARNHPMKDHQTFIDAAIQVLSIRRETVFVAAGRDVPTLSVSMPGAVQQLGHQLLLLPEQSNIAEIMNGLDVCVLSSAWGEGFPNVLGEAMACGVPCVATDVGDCATIIEDARFVVPPRSPGHLAAAILAAGAVDQESRVALAQSARNKIVARYSLDSVVRRYEQTWDDAVHSQGR